ncbi:MAG TPA: pyridoxal-phosphate dependent enzyme, partial [Thermomonospora sp.]|nr:pyridoxal-phosphate dependent enzyme [Thermomonospora sp.]
MSAASVTRVAVVGLGWAAREIWLRRLHAHPAFTVTAAVDPDPEARAAAEAGGLAGRVLASADELDPAEVDLAVVAVPNHLHCPIAAGLLTRGVAVFVEKPVCLSAEEARRLAEAEGMTLVPAFDAPEVVAGQGTIGLEIARQAPATRMIVIPIGGGSLASGVAIAAKAKLPDVRVIGVQAEACAPFVPSLAAHRPIGARSARTICDGIAVKR